MKILNSTEIKYGMELETLLKNTDIIQDIKVIENKG